jgi:hypothetical protein
MNATQPDRHPGGNSLVARHAARLNSCWPQVRVESVQVTTRDVGLSARALVQLGGLTPADVRVELMPCDLADAMSPSSRGEGRMFSSRGLGNGCFTFDAALPHPDSISTREWLIHVHPSEALEGPMVEYRFRSGGPPDHAISPSA